MKLIAGLGNPGEKYEFTRHNVGFMVLDKFLKDFETVEKTIWEHSDKFKSDFIKINWQPKRGENQEVILAKPQTFMNNSGLGVKLLMDYYRIIPEDVWIVHDELDLPIGGLKIRYDGSSAGHRGIESIIEHLGTNRFVRFRVGIGKPFKVKDPRKMGRRDREKVDEYVLSKLNDHEAHLYKEMIKKTVKAIRVSLTKDLEAAMNQFNAK